MAIKTRRYLNFDSRRGARERRRSRRASEKKKVLAKVTLGFNYSSSSLSSLSSLVVVVVVVEGVTREIRSHLSSYVFTLRRALFIFSPRFFFIFFYSPWSNLKFFFFFTVKYERERRRED